MKNTIRTAAAGCAGMFTLMFAAGAAAQAFPAKPLRLLVTYAAGGASDIMSRLLASTLTDSLRQQVIVDNRPGASGIIASELLVRSPADGYTIINVNVAHGANPTLNARLPYDTAKDFASVSLLVLLPTILVVHPSLPVRTVRELIALTKSRPGQLNYASAGSGSANHLAMELLMHAAGIEIAHVPYKGGAPAITDLLGGHVPMMFITIPPALPHVKADRLRVLAVSSARRAPTLPDVPTLAESGVAGFEFNEWQAILAPRGTPADIIGRLNVEINKALALPDVKERMVGLGAEAAAGTPEQLTAHIASELAKWPVVIRKSSMATQ